MAILTNVLKFHLIKIIFMCMTIHHATNVESVSFVYPACFMQKDTAFGYGEKKTSILILIHTCGQFWPLHWY